MALQHFWRPLALVSVAALLIAVAASAFAQAPPTPPHQFWGSTAGSGVTLDGEPAPDGAVVTAWSADGAAVATATISGGNWSLNVNPDEADAVVFTINGSLPSASFEVQSGMVTEVGLDLSSPPADEPSADDADDTVATDDAAADDADAAADDTAAAPESMDLPETGSGGLADRGGNLPVAALIFAISMLVGAAGVMAVRRIRA